MGDNTNIEFLIQILSAGVIASLVTGIFSLIISIRNNKKLINIEVMKQKFSMDSKIYMLLQEYLIRLEEKYEQFEYKGEVTMTFGCLKEILHCHLEMITFLESEHDKNSFLFNGDENQLIKNQIQKIDSLIDKYIKIFGDTDDVDIQELTNYIDSICLKIHDFYQSYLELIKNKIGSILNVESTNNF